MNRHSESQLLRRTAALLAFNSLLLTNAGCAFEKLQVDKFKLDPRGSNQSSAEQLELPFTEVPAAK